MDFIIRTPNRYGPTILNFDTSGKRWLVDEFPYVENSRELKYVDTKDIKMISKISKRLEDSDGLKYWDVSNVESLRECFMDSRIEDFSGISNWDVSKVQGALAAFESCEMKDLRFLSGWFRNGSSLLKTNSMFNQCNHLESVAGVENWDVSKVKSFRYMFSSCTRLETLDGLENWQVDKDADFTLMFSNCDSLVDCSAIDNWNLDKNYVGLFHCCKKIQRYPVWYDKDHAIQNEVVDLNVQIPIEKEYDTFTGRIEYRDFRRLPRFGTTSIRHPPRH